MNMRPATRIVVCNGADPGSAVHSSERRPLHLEYREDVAQTRNVRLRLPNFIRDVRHLPPRILDLLEIASYVYAADRLTSRGAIDSVEYHAWARELEFVIRVRDADFWNSDGVHATLAAMLSFMTGDASYTFHFQPGHETPPAGLFDDPQFSLDEQRPCAVVLFSGGLDSLAGVLQGLTSTSDQLYLVSHQSGQPGTSRTQNQLFAALHERHPRRLHHFKFSSGLSGVASAEETQRSRSFLYSSIAYALSYALGQDRFFIHENGVTAINFPKRQDLINARASRTTHPKTVVLLERFLSLVSGRPFHVETPFLFKTKADVLKVLAEAGGNELISSAVSCSQTRQNQRITTHCGGCSQCIDRRLSAFAAQVDDIDDAGIYTFDFLGMDTQGDAERSNLMDYIRQARDFERWGADQFAFEMTNALVDVLDYIPGHSPEEALERVCALCERHGQQIGHALDRIRSKFDHPYNKAPKGLLLQLINKRAYLKEPVEQLVEEVCERLTRYLRLAFQNHPPKDENDLNDKIQACLNADKPAFEREYPSVTFALAKAVPDHSFETGNLLIESKYLRGSTVPSKASEAIAADLTKYPSDRYLLFVIYDPQNSIADDEKYTQAITQKRTHCRVLIVH